MTRSTQSSAAEIGMGCRVFKTLFLLSDPPLLRYIVLRAAIVFVVMLTIGLLYTLARGSLGDPPYPTSDGHDYHHLAVNLSQGDGYRFDWTDPASKAAYVPFNSDGKYDEVMSRTGVGPTTQRPPGYPGLLALIYAVIGPWFGWARLANLVMMSLAAALAVAFAEKRGGALTAIVAGAGMIVADPMLIWHSSQIMTEGMAAMLVMLIIFSVDQVLRQPSWRWGLLIGGLFGLLTLVRPNFTIWLPMIAAIMVWFYWRHWSDWSPASRTRNVVCVGAMCAAMVLVAGPWWIRNCRTTERFTPLGTLGSQSLAGAYSDTALASAGNWRPEKGSLAKARLDPDFENASYAQREYLIGIASQELAVAWLADNYSWLPWLWLARIASLFGLSHPFDLIRFLLLPLGVLVVWRWPGGRVIVAAVALNALVVTLTWSHNGRFLAPIRPLVHIAAAAAVVAIIDWVARKLRSFAANRFESPPAARP